MTSEEPKPGDIDRIRRGQEASQMVDHLSLLVAERNLKLRSEAYKELEKGGLDPQKAVQLFISMHEGEKLIVGLRREMRLGTVSGERVAPIVRTRLPHAPGGNSGVQ